MAQANQIVVWGNLTRDPELRFFDNGNNVCNTGIAINKKWTSPDGKENETTEFLDLAIWGQMGENVAESFSSGDRVMVVGSIKINRVEDNDGNKKQYPEISVEEIGATTRWSVTTIQKNEKSNNKSSNYTTPEEKF